MFAELLDTHQSVSPIVWLNAWMLVFFSTSFNYFGIAAGSYWYFWKNPRSNATQMHANKIPPNQIRHEIFWSMTSIALFATLGIVLVAAWRQDLFPLLYFKPLEHGFWYLIVSFITFLLIQDLLFYWTHRLLHTKRLLRFHRTHHVSRVPTPFALYCFHPIEAIIHFLRLPLVLILCPVNFFALLLAEGIVSNILNAYSHLNYEPRWIKNVRVLHSRIGAASAYHSLHHLRGHGNYGSYLRLWDRLHKTQLAESAQTDDKSYNV